MTHIINILLALSILWIIVAVIGVVIEIIRKKKGKRLTVPDENKEYRQYIENIKNGNYGKAASFLEKYYGYDNHEVLKPSRPYGSPRRPAGIRDIGEEKLDEKVKKPGEKNGGSTLFKGNYNGKTYRNSKKRRRKMLESTIGGIY